MEVGRCGEKGPRKGRCRNKRAWMAEGARGRAAAEETSHRLLAIIILEGCWLFRGVKVLIGVFVETGFFLESDG
jgi:hypothetical protein